MADTKGNKEKKKNSKSPDEAGPNNKSSKDETAKPSIGNAKMSRKKKDEQDLFKPTLDAPSSVPMESKGTDSTLQDFSPDIGKEKKNEEDDMIRRPLKWHPDEIRCDKLCDNCLKINYYWPPRLRPPTPPDKDPNLIYPGDVDPDFKPARGDILIVHPRGLGLDPKPSPEELWWKSKRIGGGFCICHDGDKKFKFEQGDLILRIGSYAEGETEADLDNEEQPMEGNKQTKKGQTGGKTQPKPKRIADPPQLDPVIYKPHERVELYRCSGFEILIEDKPLDEDALEAELKRVFETNTNYEFSLEKNMNPNESNNSRRKSEKAGNPIGNGTVKQIPVPILDNPRKISSLKGMETNTPKQLEPLIHPESTLGSLTAENLARNCVASRDMQKSQGSQRDVELQELDTKERASKDEKQSKIKLIWTFLGSQAKLFTDDSIAPVSDPSCPGLGCFYHPYFNLGNHCKKQEHTHTPYLGEILIPEGVWFKKFNHRKNKWRSMVEWYVPFCPPLPSPLEGEASTLIGDLGKDKEASNSDKKRNSKISQKMGKNDKDDKAEDKTKVVKGKGNEKEEKLKNADSSKKEDHGLVQADSVGKNGRVGKGKEMVQLDESHSNEALGQADKAVQVPEDLEQVLKDEDLDSPVVPINWNNEPTLGTIVLRPLVGRQLKDEKTPVEEWKWPRKNKIWGAVEMYMVEHGTEGLDWVFWGKSDRICDTSYPPPQPGAKLKFLHPNDAKLEIPRNSKDLEEESQKGQDKDPNKDIFGVVPSAMLETPSPNMGEVGNKNKKQKVEMNKK